MKTLLMTFKVKWNMTTTLDSGDGEDRKVVVQLTTIVATGAAPVDSGLNECATFPPCLHEGLGIEGEAEEATTKEAEEERDEGDFDDEEWPWPPRSHCHR
ncbi:hypothetical protein ABZP36_030019 [Zizania latifolia]